MPTTTQVEATLNVNAIGARTDFSGTEVDDLSAEEIRFDQSIFDAGILSPSNAFEVVADTNMDVIAGSGTAKTDYAYVSGDTAGQGNYLVRLDDVSKTITLAAPDSSQDRTDEIYLVVLDDVYDSSTKALPIFAVRRGDVGGGLPGPDGGWQAYLKLATITVPGGSSDITEATIQDNRVNAKMVVPAIEATDGTFNGVDLAAHAHTGATGQGAQIDANDLTNLQAAANAANLDADTVDGQHASEFAAASHVGATGNAHGLATESVDGFMAAVSVTKLNGIEPGATADQTAEQILAAVKTVDGSGSGLDADLLDGNHASSFATSGHNHNGASLRASDGSVSSSGIGFANDMDTGFYRNGNQIRWTSAGNFGGHLSLTGVALPDDTSSNPGLSWANDGGTGLHRPTSGIMAVVANATEVVRFSGSGVSPSFTWPHNNSNGSLRWMGTGSVFAQAHTGSSEEHKVYIKEIDLEKSVFNRLDPIHFKYSKNHPHKERYGDSWDEFENPEIGRMGFSYEQLSEVAPHWTYEADGMKAVSYEGMLPDFMAYSTAAIQQLTARVSELEAQLEAVA